MFGTDQLGTRNSSGGRHSSVLLRKLVCFLALFAAAFSVVTPALCAPRDCICTTPRSSGKCHDMPMGPETDTLAPSPVARCCDLTQNPVSATATPVVTAPDLQVVAVLLFAITVPPAPVSESSAAQNFAASSPPDLQSLFC